MRGYDSWCFIKYRIIVRENYRTIVPKANFFFTRIKYIVDIFLWKIHKTQKYVNKNISGKAFDVHLLLTFKISWFETKWISVSNEVSTLDIRNVRQVPERLNYDSFVTTITYRTSQTEVTSFLSFSLLPLCPSEALRFAGFTVSTAYARSLARQCARRANTRVYTNPARRASSLRICST